MWWNEWNFIWTITFLIAISICPLTTKIILQWNALLYWVWWSWAQVFLLLDNPKNQRLKDLCLVFILSYEQGLGKSNTLEIGGGLNGVSWLEDAGDFDDFRFGLAPFAEATFRNYYNLEKRQSKGKRTAMNSGNYWGIHARYLFEPIAGDTGDSQFSSVFIAPVWGFQRNYNSHFSLGMDFGLGVGFNNSDAYFSPLVRLKLGFVLFSHAGK